MKRYLGYLHALLRHKYYVFLEGRKIGLGIIRLLIHDWDKFGPRMFKSYARSFYSPEGFNWYNPDPDFAYTWNRHQKVNRHHWQAWLLTWDRGETDALKMDPDDVKEMIADWRGAGRAYNKDWTPEETIEWYKKNRTKMILHPDTRSYVEHLLGYRAEPESLKPAEGFEPPTPSLQN